MSRILIAGLWMPGAGLTNVLAALVSELRHEFEIRCLGFEPALVRHEVDVTIGGCEARLRRGPARAFAAEAAWLERELASHRPDAVLVMGPAFLSEPLLRQLQPFRGMMRIILYLPIEGSLANDDLAPIIELTDVCITYTEVARADVAALCRRASARDPEYREPRLEVIGHGFDASAFFRIDAPDERTRRIAARRILYDRDLDEAFIVLNSNRPYFRKRLDLTIAAFGLFARNKPDAHLHLHTGWRSPAVDADLRREIAESGAGARIHLTPSTGNESVRPAAWLNTLYNACDVGLSTSMGEGWGLGMFEHAATRAALIVPEHTTFIENWRDAALLVPAPGREFVFYEAATMAVVSAVDVAAALERLYRNCALREHLASAAFERAHHQRYTWTEAAARFAGLLREDFAHVPITATPAGAQRGGRQRRAVAAAGH